MSFFNKKAAANLFKKTGYYYAASDLVDELPKTMYNSLKFRIK